MLIAANYHYIRPSFDLPYPSIFGLTPEQFDAQLEELARYGEFVGAGDIQSAVRGERRLPERSWAITFDDGLREQFELAWPVLRARGIPAIFYINTDPIANRRIALVHKIHLLRGHIAPAVLEAEIRRHADAWEIAIPEVDSAVASGVYKYDTPEVARLKYTLNFALDPRDVERLMERCFATLLGGDEARQAEELYMSVEQVRELASYGCIGTHGHEHLPMGRLAPEAARDQIRTSLRLLSTWTPEPIVTLSYPYGSHDACSPDAAELAVQEGVEFAFTMERASNAEMDAPMFLARCACNDVPGGSSPRWNPDHIFQEIPVAQWYRGSSYAAR